VERFGHGQVLEYKNFYGVTLSFLKGFEAHLKILEVSSMSLSQLPNGVSQFLIPNSVTPTPGMLNLESINGLNLFFQPLEVLSSPLNVTFGLVLEPRILASIETLEALVEITGNAGLTETLNYSFGEHLGLQKEQKMLNATYLENVPLTHPAQILPILRVRSSFAFSKAFL
jgi:hypothetical protein